MDFRLLISIIVLDLALHTSQVSCQVSLLKNFDPQDCIIEGTVVTLTCTVEDHNIGHGATIINGSQAIFDCPSVSTVQNNRLYLNHVHAHSAIARCGDLVWGKIMEVENGIYISEITITTTIAMNGGYVECSDLGIRDRQQIKLANIKDSPDTTIYVQFPFYATFRIHYSTLSNEGDQISHYFTDVIGEECGQCTNLGLVSNVTNQLSCTGWEPNGQDCNVTVTAAILSAYSVCGLQLLSSSRLIFLQDTAPTDIVVTVICSNNFYHPDVQVEWEYTLPEPSRLIPGVNGFLVNISNPNKNVSHFLPDSEARSYVFSSTSLQQTGLEGDVETIVTVVTEVGRFHNNLTFSLEGIMTDISSTLTIEQCIEVSINQRCNESADSFQAHLQFADGACEESRLNKTTENYTLQHDYETCIRVGTDPICFSAVMSRNGVEVARTGSEELILLQCNTSNLSSVYNNGVTVTNSTTMGVVTRGTKVLHNTVLSFQCTILCKLMGTNITRCVNGTFESLLNESSHCDCEQRTAVIAAVASVGGLVAVIAIIIIIIPICIVRIKDSLRAYFPEKQEAKDRKSKKSDPVEHIDQHTFSDW